jgi:DNA-binding transcriptional MocR family regulator
MKDDQVTFDGRPDPGTINFGVGQPSADLLPVDLMKAASDAFLNSAHPVELNYGEVQGDLRFRETLASFLSSGYEATVRPDSLFLTSGNSQALDYVCERFTRPGDTVFVEEPSYFLAFQIFADHGLEVVGIPVDGQGLRVDRLEAELAHRRPVLVYTIPSYHNPGGQSLSLKRRERLAQLSLEHGFIIVADEVYQLLSYFDSPPAAMGTMIDRGNVLSLGSFSKILAPGLRLGWIQATPDLLKQLLSSGVVNSGGSLNHFTSHLVRHAIELGLQQAHIEQLRSSYRARLLAMDDALRDRLGEQASWRRPDGGYFFWLQMKQGLDTSRLRGMALKSGTGFQPGKVFSSRGGLDHFLRLSFAHYAEDDIREGVGRLAECVNRLQQGLVTG